MPVVWPAIGAAILPNIGGWVNGYFLVDQVRTWYPTLILPKWSPPGWVFISVWTILYFSMGYASYLVWRDGGGFTGAAQLPLALYASQLALNWAWPLIFFGAHNLKWSLVEICIWWLNVAGCGYFFFSINSTAGFLMVPYLAWLTFDTSLSYCVYRDNPKSKEPLI
ncbi:translocator protein-like isoform X2 [Anabrus simplex]